MNALIKVPYEIAWRIANVIAPFVPESENKIARTLRARAGLRGKIDAWAGAHRDPTRPLLWIHASSVGESLQALPVLSLFRERKPQVQILFTFYSPSAESTAKKFPADFVCYLPFDTSHLMRHVIASVRPSAIVFSKLDVWPSLVFEASRAGIPTAIISATLHSDSGRRSRLASVLLQNTYEAIKSIGAISEEDRANIIQLGAAESRVAVTGDTRFDQVWARRQQGGPRELLNHLDSSRPTLVAGSTWESDEEYLLPAFVEARATCRRLRLIIAPHEPSPKNLSGLNDWAAANSFSLASLDNPHAAGTDIVVVNRVGVLGDLYALADVAYVGGGFNRAGLHSVLEPAAFAKPVLFGAPFARSRDADLLLTASGARAVASKDELTAALVLWFGDSVVRERAGTAAEQVVRQGLGAAEAAYNLINMLL